MFVFEISNDIFDNKMIFISLVDVLKFLNVNLNIIIVYWLFIFVLNLFRIYI